MKIYCMQNAAFHFNCCGIHGSAFKITLCHAQNINSPIGPFGNFGLQISPYYHKTLGKQKLSSHNQFCISYDEYNSTNCVKFCNAVLKQACKVINHLKDYKARCLYRAIQYAH